MTTEVGHACTVTSDWSDLLAGTEFETHRPQLLLLQMGCYSSWLLITATETNNLDLADKSKLHFAESHRKSLFKHSMRNAYPITNHRAAGGERYPSII